MVRKANPKNLKKVFDKLEKFLEEYPDLGKKFCLKFNDLLDELLSQDFFGTEGQCDPRGDHRNTPLSS